MDSTLTNPPTTSRRSILLTIIFVAVSLIALYYLYRFLYTTATIQKTILVSREIPGNVVPTSLPGIPAIYEGGEYTVSVWLYVNSYNVNRNSRKHILEIGGAQFSTLLIGLGAFKNTLFIRTHTADAVNSVEGYQDWVPSGIRGAGGQFDVDSSGYTDACPKGSINIMTGMPCAPVPGLKGPADDYSKYDVNPSYNAGNRQLTQTENEQRGLTKEYMEKLDPASRALYAKMRSLGQKVASGDEDNSNAYKENQIVEYEDVISGSNRNTTSGSGDSSSPYEGSAQLQYEKDLMKKLKNELSNSKYKYDSKSGSYRQGGQTGASGYSHSDSSSSAGNAPSTVTDRTPSSTDTPNSNDPTAGGSLTRASVDSFFKPLALDDSLLTTNVKCDLPEIDMQRWTLLTVNINGRTTDVYLDGKLARSCVSSSYYKVDPTGVKMNLCDYGGFDGHLNGVTVYSYSLTPSEIYSIYVAGPNANGTSDVFSWLFSPFKRA
jgi:hypothetical protein